MGGEESKPPPRQPSPPPPKLEFDQPWRRIPWGKNSEIEQKLRDFKLKHPSVRFVRILLIGNVGAGKSSFINSVNNVFQKRITCDALTNTTSGTSFTKTYETYYIERKDGSHLPFAFSDVMGLEDEEKGASSENIIKALSGFLQEGFNFDPTSTKPMNDPAYRSNPSLEDQTCCLVNIVAADKISLMKDGVINKMNKIREAASKLKIPQVIIMTRPDLACPLVHHDIRKIYTSKKIKEKMKLCSHRLGIPINHIFPVKTYHEEIDTDDDMDLLILKALDQIVNIAADNLNKKSFNSGEKAE
ncbi:interferon-induced protein 44-like [Hemibagrus wyckioides]|uniref:interferon-induced protein 44-like n=1 Tax=Hemibagrus wyckioides TaxID=337641 RepID=UPI00266B7FD4|nr:interferon-induced protein 44-like [Hemibagrus wyckioides]XP_058235911.1 interferon-induced protein 44-like [Hemibagrus wyckioides]XP_058235912.1 interferon-induced protein 44-like [Hemibagrus wyckioides]